MYNQFKLLAALILVLPLASASPAPAPSLVERQAATTTTTCATGAHLMVAGGCAPPCQTGDNYGLLATLVGNITAAIPGTDVYLVPYNTTTPGVNATPTMVQAANSYAVTCPNTPMIFIGYSVGGIIIMNSLCGKVNANISSNVILANFYGEETYLGNMPYDKGSCTNNAPLYPRASTALCAPFVPVMSSYCFDTDPNCCTNGTLPLAHFAYPGYYDQIVLGNAISAYSSFTAALATRTAATSSSTSSSTSSTSSSSSSTSSSSSSTSSSSSSTSSSSSSSSSSSTSSTSSSTSSSKSSSSSVKPIRVITRTNTHTIKNKKTTTTRTITTTFTPTKQFAKATV